MKEFFGGTGMKLSVIRAGGVCTVIGVDGEIRFRRHMYDMGITPGVKITVKRVAPFGDPMLISLRGYSLIMRNSEAQLITVKPVAV